MLAHEKWVSYFESRPCGDVYSELLKISQFFFCIMGHNANLERIFSLMDVQWTNERDNLSVESVKSMLQVLYNFESMSCRQFYDFIKSNKKLLKKVSSSDKYPWLKNG